MRLCDLKEEVLKKEAPKPASIEQTLTLVAQQMGLDSRLQSNNSKPAMFENGLEINASLP